MTETRFLRNEIIKILEDTDDNKEVIGFFRSYISKIDKEWFILEDIVFKKYDEILFTAINMLYIHHVINLKIKSNTDDGNYERSLNVIASFTLFTAIFSLLDKLILQKKDVIRLFEIMNEFNMHINCHERNDKEVKELIEKDLCSKIHNVLVV
ncbi:hypothetical protein EDEG_00498 [Edhazardia aedis USNM 41457]|uniref:Uncharacterized protein n=1 Tax=Edhazardia aedis (strain USNM 41457) TaxID=1003232 RepID=J8ZNP9_EDHAE|nr:hypothetical protein EDEG_00498 [Edhazardia aedis USNM 41457]|eukprot:EJW01313.1 hypothetical protein EDEG_00498 [Edhazardia aedis USNM 41457]